MIKPKTLTLTEWLAANPDIESCSLCHNSGVVDCPECCGEGEIPCCNCDGKGCDACLGGGWFGCDNCDVAGDIACVCDGAAKKAYHAALAKETELYQQWMAASG